MIQIIKKDNTIQPFDISKVISAVNKSAYRAIYRFSDNEVSLIENFVTSAVNDPNNWEKEENGDGYLTVPMMHNIVEKCLTNIAPTVAQSYRDYRNYKTSFVAILDSVYKKSQAIMYIGDKENANSDSTLVSTKRSLIFGQLNKELYQKFQLTVKQLQACKDGYIYVHDMSSRRDCINCCLADVGNVLKGGFEMGNIWYNEPKSLDVAFDVIGDIILSAAAQQYGGYTVPRIDEILIPYAQKSYDIHFNKHFKSKMRSIMNVMGYTSEDEVYHNFKTNIEKEAHEEAMIDVRREMEQGFQGLEIKLNTVASSRGDYPFTTFTIGVSTDTFASMAAEVCLEVRAKGQGAPEKKKSVLFPKLVFTYTEDLHGEGKELNWLFEKALDCSLRAMYPDFLSLDGDTVVAKMWHKYGEVIAPMGCRAFLSPFYERGGAEPADEDDKPFFTGRFNIGVVSLNLPMIYAKSKQENIDFYTVLDEYLELAREVHIMTYNYLGNMRASTNPVMCCQGGFHNGNLNPNDKIKPLLRYATASFGITALNELNRIHNGKSIREDGQFPLEVMEYINKKAKEFKAEDHINYAIYGTPAESLCGTQVNQFRAKYGIVENVSDRDYVSNSFHCHVSEEMDGIEKQDKEFRFWELFQGGRIQYVKYDINYNKDAVRSYVKRAMKMGLYEGVNFTLCYCEDCGKEGVGVDECPKCGSKNLTKIERMNGYLSYSRVHGDTRLNSAKMAEIADRKSM